MKKRRNTTAKGTRYEKHVAAKMRWHGYLFVRRVGRAGDFGADCIGYTWLLRKVTQPRLTIRPAGQSLQRIARSRSQPGSWRELAEFSFGRDIKRKAFFARYEPQNKADELYDRIFKIVGRE